MPQSTSASKYISGISGYHGCGNSLLNKRKAFSCKQKLRHWKKKKSESPKKEIKLKLNYYVQDKTILEESTKYDFTDVLHGTFNFCFSFFFLFL